MGLATREHVCWGAAAILVAFAPAWAQTRAADGPPMVPWDFSAEFERMFDRVFGQETEEDKEAVARVEVSIQEEQRLGQAALDAYLADLKRQRIAVVNRGKEVAYLRDLVKTIHPRMEHADRYRSFTVYVARSPKCDARCFPGGTIVFFEGLLAEAGNEAALVGIVGHEMSHFDRGHHLWRLRQWKLAQQRLASGPAAFASPQSFGGIGAMMARMWMRPFRPEQEAEADQDGARWAYRAGYDPREMAKLFARLGRQQADRVPMPAFFQSHPAPESRSRGILEVYDELQRAEPADRLYIGARNLRERIARSRQQFKD